MIRSFRLSPTPLSFFCFSGVSPRELPGVEGEGREGWSVYSLSSSFRSRNHTKFCEKHPKPNRKLSQNLSTSPVTPTHRPGAADGFSCAPVAAAFGASHRSRRRGGEAEGAVGRVSGVWNTAETETEQGLGILKLHRSQLFFLLNAIELFLVQWPCVARGS